MLCKNAGVIDFDDMILKCRVLFCRHEAVLRKWKKRYRYFLVDEFQDINDGQYELLRLLAGDEMNVFAVGENSTIKKTCQLFAIKKVDMLISV